MTTDEECGVCWASHMCHLPVRHEGDHGCVDEDDEGLPHSRCPRNAEYVYNLDLLRYPNGDFCDICGPITPPTEHIHGVLDHAMTHTELWAKDYAEHYADYLGNGQWVSP